LDKFQQSQRERQERDYAKERGLDIDLMRKESSSAKRKGMGARTCAPVLILVATLAWAIALPLSGCAVHKNALQKKTTPNQDVFFKGCVITETVAGKSTCACRNPKVETVLDARTGKSYQVAYCESQVQQ
jgi:hypothetical protein